MVSCEAGSKDIFYNESFWPVGANCPTESSMAKKTDDSTDMKKGDNNRSDTHSDSGIKYCD